MRTVLAAVLIASGVCIATAQTPAPRPDEARPNFSVQVWGDTVADFAARVQQYFELRRKLEAGLPPLVVTDNASDILAAEFALARRVRHARRTAKPGDIFTPAIAKAFRTVLAPALSGLTLEVILD